MTIRILFACLGILSSLLQVVGVFLMANVLLNVNRAPGVLLISALVRGRKVQDHIELMKGLSEENKVKSLQGLCFIGIGFLFDLTGKLHDLFASSAGAP